MEKNRKSIRECDATTQVILLKIFSKIQEKPMNTRLAAPGAAGAPGVAGAKPMPFKAALPRYFACKVLNAILSVGSN